MKLTSELKERIDTYFDSISPEDLFSRAISEYGFEEIISVSDSFETIEVNNSIVLAGLIDYSSFITEGEEIITLAA